MDRGKLLAGLRALPTRNRIITALDVPTPAEAYGFAKRLGPDGRFVKVGLELFSATGPAIIAGLSALGKEIFLDLKYHDIPNTVASAAGVAAHLGVAMCTVHAAAGRTAMTAAAAALAAAPPGPLGRRPALLAVTVLTSLSDAELHEVSPSPDQVQDRVDRLARLAWDCGCDGLVCSAADLSRLRTVVGSEPLVVTPGIRPVGAATDDQRRVTTAGAGLNAGADYLVVGRPITRATDPGAALAALADELTAND